MIFTNIEQIELPQQPRVGEGFTVVMITNGEVPFPQLILRHADGWERLIKDQQVTYDGDGRYCFLVPPVAYHAGPAYLQIEGCRVADLSAASPQDWLKVYRELQIAEATPAISPEEKIAVTSKETAREVPQVAETPQKVAAAPTTVKVTSATSQPAKPRHK
jgi:hypothetical protein